MSVLLQQNQKFVESDGHLTLEGLMFLGGVHTWVPAPSSSSAPGTQGQLAYDQNYVYLCVQKNTWKRIALGSY